MEPNIHLLLKEAFTHFGEGDFGAAKTGLKKPTGLILIILKSWTLSNAAFTGKSGRPT
jgi:hypothetical protein